MKVRAIIFLFIVALPKDKGARPAPEFLKWHHEIYKG